MSRDFYHAFQRCLARAQSGVPLEECVAQYPEHADELRPLLRAATAPADQRDSAMPRAARARVRQRVMGHWDRTRPPRRSWWALSGFEPARWAVAAAILVALLTLSGGVGVATAAQDAMPGASLYPVKLFREDARLWFTTSPQEKVLIYSRYAQERVREMHLLGQNGSGSAAAIAMSRLEGHLGAVDRLAAEVPPGEPLVELGRLAIIETLSGNLAAPQQAEAAPDVLAEVPQGAYPCLQHTMQAIHQAREQVRSALERVGGDLPNSPDDQSDRVDAFCPP